MFGKKKIKVVIDGATEKWSAADIIQLIRERNQAREQRDTAIAKRDEFRWEARTAEERFEAANAKLKEYGHPGL